MAHILIMPRQGNTVESCIIVDWKVKQGDHVTSETTICEVETDKATFEIPAGAAGTVLVILCDAGDDVPVLAPIAVIGAVGEDWQTALGSVEPGAGSRDCCSKDNIESSKINSQTSTPDPQSQPSTPNSQLPNPNFAISPRARNLAEKEALSIETLPGTGPGGRIIERDVQTALEQRPLLTAAAKAAGVGASGSEVSRAIPMAGSGIGGRVTVSDIDSQFSAIQSSFTAPNSRLKTPYSAEGAITETPIKGIRKVISDRMIKSLSETAQFTINASASAARLQDIRSRMKSFEYLPEDLKNAKITVNDLILFAVSRVLPRFLYMNSHKTGDIIKTFERIHLGVAMDTPRGLLVPVIRNANLLSLTQISSESKRLSAACHNGSAKPDELSGSTFSVTNLGSLGITGFTPVLNIPEAATLGVCGIEMKPVASNAEANNCNCNFRLEPHIGFSLTINHQIVDGAPAARFLKALCEAVANIDILLSAG